MADSQHTLEIRSTLKDEASGKLKKMGVEGEKAGKRTEGSLKGVEKQADKTGRSMLDAGQAGSKGAGIAGAGFSSLAAGMTAAAATSENLEASMVSVGAAVAAAFAAGGPVGAGLALAATGLGLLIGDSNKAAQAAKALGDEFKKAGEAAESAMRAADDTIRSLLTDIYELDSVIEGTTFDRTFVSMQDAIRKTKEQIAESVKQEEFLLEKFRNAEGITKEMLVNFDFQIEQQGQLTLKLRDQLELQRERMRTYIEARKVTAEREKQEAAVNEQLDIGVSWGREAQEIAEQTVEIQEKQVDVIGEQVKAIAKVADGVGAAVAAFEREQNRISDGNRRLQDRIDILNASSSRQKDLIRLEQEKRDLLDQGLDAKKVEEYYEQRILDIAERYAESAEKSVALENAKASAAERTTRAKKEDLDITKRFASVAGTGGLFGFGAGRVGAGTFQGGEVSRRRRAAPAAGAGGGAGAGASLPDPSPAIKEAAGGIAEIRPLFAKMAETGKMLAKEVRRTIKDSTAYVSDFAAVTASEIRSIRSDITTLKKNLSRAGDFGVAGGA